jgi:hypothetical protein
MSEGFIEAIQKAFDIRLQQFGTTNAIQIALENINAPTNPAIPYLAGYCLPAAVDQADLYFSERRSGIYQIDINYAQSVGSGPSNRMADLLNVAFKPDSTLTRTPVCITITSVSPGPLIVQNGWAKRPLTINWITHTTRL